MGGRVKNYLSALWRKPSASDMFVMLIGCLLSSALTLAITIHAGFTIPERRERSELQRRLEQAQRYYDEGNLKESLELCNQVLEYTSRSRFADLFAESNMLKAQCYFGRWPLSRNRRDLELAANSGLLAVNSFVLFEGYSRDIADALTLIGRAETTWAELTHYLPVLERGKRRLYQALHLSRELDELRQVQILGELCETHRLLARHVSREANLAVARQRCEKALALGEQSKDQDLLGRIYHYQGKVLLEIYAKDGHPETLANAETALGLAKENYPLVVYPSQNAEIDHTLGKFYYRIFETTRDRDHLYTSINSYLQALENRPSGYDRGTTLSNLAAALVVLSEIESQQANGKKALDYATEAVAELPRDSFPSQHAVARMTVGMAQMRLAVGDEALQKLGHALSEFIASRAITNPDTNPRDFTILMNNMGEAYMALAELQNWCQNAALALDCFHTAIHHVKLLGEPVMEKYIQSWVEKAQHGQCS